MAGYRHTVFLLGTAVIGLAVAYLTRPASVDVNAIIAAAGNCSGADNRKVTTK